MAIVAKEAKKDPTLGGRTLSKALEDVNVNRILTESEDAINDLAPGKTVAEKKRNSWMTEASSGKRGSDNFKKMLIKGQFITPKIP